MLAASILEASKFIHQGPRMLLCRSLSALGPLLQAVLRNWKAVGSKFSLHRLDGCAINGILILNTWSFLFQAFSITPISVRLARLSLPRMSVSNLLSSSNLALLQELRSVHLGQLLSQMARSRTRTRPVRLYRDCSRVGKSSPHPYSHLLLALKNNHG